MHRQNDRNLNGTPEALQLPVSFDRFNQGVGADRGGVNAYPVD